MCKSFYDEGDIYNFITVYHELRHILQNINIKMGFFSYDTLMMIKDHLIKKYEQKQFGTDNYYDISFEVDARKYSVLSVIDFLLKFGYEISDNSLRYLKNEFINDIKEER